MKKPVVIGIIAIIISIGVIVALSYVVPAGSNNPANVPTNSQNTTVTVTPQTVNNATTVTAQNTTGKHFNITLQEQVGIKTK
ncbi:MAG: hypothetical protein KGH89_00780 [Thaumarchaeota archaeon]|nr:hypothetical protein [Nitrososphaerota archaeon]